MFGYVVLAAVIGFVPGGMFILIPLEAWIVFHIAHGYGVENLAEIIWFCGVAVTLSTFLKVTATALHLIPVVGQIANSVVASLFIYYLCEVADAHYSHAAALART